VFSRQRSPEQRSIPGGAHPRVDPNYWLVPTLRAIPALAVGLIIAFTEDHSPRVGLIWFGVFAVLTGAVVLGGARLVPADRVLRGVFIAQGITAMVAGLVALLLWNAGIGILLLIVTVFAAFTGALEGYAGLRARGFGPARDWLTVGGYTAVAAVVFVLIPPDPILATGLIGAYAIILGVFLVIAGLSLKWATDKPDDSAAERKVSL
jgi:uncharacterized membrane protein HdeD (DUF308 family)